jgi:hypothetical protein
MAFYLRGKMSVVTNDLSPKEATAMSRDIYIGMDVYKEAIVIAVLNGRGSWSWKPSSKPKPAAFCNSSMVYRASSM